MIDEIAKLRMEIEALKNTISRMIVSGTIEVIDGEKGYRMKTGEDKDGNPILSPYYPHPETDKTSVPLKKGQNVTALNPFGDPRQGFLVRGGYSEGNPSPNTDMAANVFADAGVELMVKGGALHVKAEGEVIIVAPKVSVNP